MCSSHRRRISALSSGLVRRRPSDRHWATASSHAARQKMKTMAGNMARSSSASMSSRAPGAGQARVAQAPGSPGQAGHPLVEGEQPGGGAPACAAAGRARPGGSPSRPRPRGCAARRAGGARRRPRSGRGPCSARPRTRRHWTPWPTGTRGHDVGRGEDEHLLPHRSPVRVLEVVHLVQHDEPEPGQLGRTGEEHVAQDLGRHDDHRGVGPVRDVAGEQPDARRPRTPRPTPRTSGWTTP